MDASREKVRVAALSVLSNGALVAGKIVVGTLTGSVSVLSEAIHSGIDLLASLIALIAVRTSGKPADPEHPWGHEKVENLSGAIEAILIFVAAIWIIYESVDKLLHPKPLDAIGLGVGIMALSSVVNLVVSRALFRVGKETDSVALVADAWHLRTDVYTSLGVMAGLGIITLGGIFLPKVDLSWLDPAIAICVAVLIMKAAFQLTRQSIADLLDTSMPENERVWITSFLRHEIREACGFHRLRTRKAGATRFVEFHLLVEPDMHVDDSHAITDRITAEMRERFPGCNVTIHIEPCDGSCEDACVAGCLVAADEREARSSKFRGGR
ncbi:MAG: cation diffusion facilitator family transporter [Proteobacteria bacterium]|nr:cation diffusion facilitator family transporter [Pseudomonadota bacterium]